MHGYSGNIEQVVAGGLCTRCGACAVCPSGAIHWDNDCYPQVDRGKCTDCRICIRVCPGIDVDFPALKETLYGEPAGLVDLLGTFRQAYVGYATDAHIRMIGTGGGVVTGLLSYLLEQEQIKAAIVVGEDPVAPWKTRPLLARTREDVLSSAKSRYAVVAVNRMLMAARGIKGKLALVGLPCHVHGFRKLATLCPEVAERVSVVVGLYCGMNLELAATLKLIRSTGTALGEVAHIEYRGGGWPGAFRVIRRDGTVKTITKLTFNYLRYLYLPRRCTLCADMANELADISVGDAWFRDQNNQYRFPNCSTILARTSAGETVLGQAAREGVLHLESVPADACRRSHFSGYVSKKRITFIRLRNARHSPDYHIEYPIVEAKYRILAFLEALVYWLGRIRLVSEIVTAILLSPFGIEGIKLVRGIKKKFHIGLK